MSVTQTLFGSGRILAQGQLLGLVEYALVINPVGRHEVARGSVIVLEGRYDLSDQVDLRLQLQDGAVAHITLASGQAVGRYNFTGTIRS